MESFWNLFKTILLIQEMNLKKIPSKKNNFSRRKNILKNDVRKKIIIFFWLFEKIRKFLTFWRKSKISFKKSNIFDFFQKSETFSDFFFRASFFKIFFVAKNYFFSTGFFLSSSPGWGESFWRGFRTIPSV